jgi:hypothetical protein
VELIRGNNFHLTEKLQKGGPELAPKIRNCDLLLSHGCRESRRIVLVVTKRVLQRLDAYERMRFFFRREGNILQVGNRSWNLREKKKFYIFKRRQSG